MVNRQFMNKANHHIGIYLLFSIIIVVALKVISYFFILFLIQPKLLLYPYADIGGVVYPKVVDLDVLDALIFVSLLGFICGLLSSFLSFWSFHKNSSFKIVNLIFIIMFVTSAIETLFFCYRFIQLQNLSSSLVSCDKFSANIPGCYIP
ncbi:hypothetical protein A6S26_26075 [Nostoc sp. ATCC 43529]|nr:hypothetical protein A6S26_26075 [Nostoc sp. ATCC 43529]